MSKPRKSSMREALESALVEGPDDLANHMAYADYLTEQGDALGEFIRVQLALEDEKKDAAERKKLKTQETKLRKKHQAAWLGELGEVIIDPKPHPEHEWSTLKAKYTFRRGWLDTLRLTSFGVEDIRVLARSPAIRLLRHLQLDNDRFEEEGEFKAGEDVPEDEYNPQLWPLARSPYLGNVRTFTLGEYPTPDEEEDADDGAICCHTEGRAAAAVVKLMPKLEELHLLAHEVDAGAIFSLRTLSNLRVLALYHNHSYPLARLAKNPAMRKLEKLLCYPHALDDDDAYIRLPQLRAIARSKELESLKHLQLRLTDVGDKGAKEVVESGLLKRLEVLDLQHGCITDKGAHALAACPDLKNLKLLDLTNNNLTDEGIRALRAAGVNVHAERQWAIGDSPGRYEEREYLYAGDIE
jgi:uncharacterized protein (TIGR02996 family)